MKSFIFFPNSRKASSEMWWIIIGAVIALVVMIVLMIMFTGKSNILEKGLLDCSGKGGECLTKDECEKSEEGTIAPFTCPEEEVCCFLKKDKTDSD